MVRGDFRIDGGHRAAAHLLDLPTRPDALFAANNGYLDDLEVAQVLPFEKGLRDYLKTKHADMIKRIEDNKDLSKDDDGALHTALKDFKKSGAY